MRWIMLLAAVLGFGLAFSARTPGLLGLGLVIGFVCLFFALLGFAAARIAATARPDTAMLTDKDMYALKASLRKTTPAPSLPPPNEDAPT